MDDKTLSTALAHVGKWASQSDVLAYMLYQVMEGDVPDDVFETLQKYGYVDENHEWIYGDEE